MIDPRREYWGRIHDMVEAYNVKHGVNIKPWECVRRGVGFFLPDENNYMTLDRHPDIKDADHTTYRFAITIIEGKPVFFKDKIYSKTGYPFQWNDLEYLNHFNYENAWTWGPPKKHRTFTLNGVELPCPVDPKKIEKGIEVHGMVVGAYDPPFWFLSKQDRNSVRAAIINILSEARADSSRSFSNETDSYRNNQTAYYR